MSEREFFQKLTSLEISLYAGNGEMEGSGERGPINTGNELEWQPRQNTPEALPASPPRQEGAGPLREEESYSREELQRMIDGNVYATLREFGFDTEVSDMVKRFGVESGSLFELAEKSEGSETDHVGAAMALRLIDFASFIQYTPVGRHSERELAVEMDQWRAFIGTLEELKKEGKSGDKDLTGSAIRIATSIREKMLKDAREGGKDIKEILTEKEKVKDELVFNEEVGNDEIRQLMTDFIFWDEQDVSAKTVEEAQRLRDRCRALQEKTADKRIDAESKRVLGKILTKLNKIEREIRAHGTTATEDRPPRHDEKEEGETEADFRSRIAKKNLEEQERLFRRSEVTDPEADALLSSVKAKYHVDPGDCDEKIFDKEMAKNLQESERVQRAFGNAVNGINNAREAKKTGDKDLDEAKKETWDKYREYKDSWRLESDMKAEMMKRPQWEEYKWYLPEMQAINAKLHGENFGELNSAQAKEVMFSLLTKGLTGREALRELEKLKPQPGRGGSVDEGYQLGFYIQGDFNQPDSNLLHVLDDEILRRFGCLSDIQQYENRKALDSPNNIEELSWQVGNSDDPNFGPKGRMPALERKVEEIVRSDGTKKLVTHEVANTENLVMWIRERIYHFHDMNKLEIFDPFQKIMLQKESPMYNYSLGQMIDRLSIFNSREEVSDAFMKEHVDGNEKIKNDQKDKLKSELKREKESYLDLAFSMLLNAHIPAVLKKRHIPYTQNMSTDQELAKVMAEALYRSDMTMKLLGSSLWHFLTSFDESYKDWKGGDGKVGAATVRMLLAYKNINNFQELQRIMGKDSALFDLNKLKKKVEKAAEKDKEMNPGNVPSEKFDFEGRMDTEMGRWVYNNKDIDAAFDENGKIKDPQKFCAFLNIFRPPANSLLVDAIQNTIREEAADAVGLEKGVDDKKSEINSWFADIMAWSSLRFTGLAAENDIVPIGDNPRKHNGPIAMDAMSKILFPREHRLKYASDRMGAIGNPHTIEVFGKFASNYFISVKTLYAGEVDNGKFETIMDVFEKLDDKSREIHDIESDESLSPAEKEKKKRELEAEYRNISSHLEFDEDAEQLYFGDNFRRGILISSRVREAQEIKLADYTHKSPEVGVVTDLEKFQKDFIGFMSDVRAILQRYPAEDFSRVDWHWDYKIGDYRQMSLAEAMFGKELLDRPEFKSPAGRYKVDPKTKKVLLDENGHKILNPEHGKMVLDPDKVQANRYLLMRQWMLTYIAGQFRQHRDYSRMAFAERYEYWYYDNFVRSLEKVIGGVEVGEDDMNDIKRLSGFRKEDIAWLRKHAGLDHWGGVLGLYELAFLNAVFMGRNTKEEQLGPGVIFEILGGIIAAAGKGH